MVPWKKSWNHLNKGGVQFIFFGFAIFAYHWGQEWGKRWKSSLRCRQCTKVSCHVSRQISTRGVLLQTKCPLPWNEQILLLEESTLLFSFSPPPFFVFFCIFSVYWKWGRGACATRDCLASSSYCDPPLKNTRRNTTIFKQLCDNK